MRCAGINLNNTGNPECVFSDNVRTPMEMLDYNRARCPTPTTLEQGLHGVVDGVGIIFHEGLCLCNGSFREKGGDIDKDSVILILVCILIPIIIIANDDFDRTSPGWQKIPKIAGRSDRKWLPIGTSACNFIENKITPVHGGLIRKVAS